MVTSWIFFGFMPIATRRGRTGSLGFSGANSLPSIRRRTLRMYARKLSGGARSPSGRSFPVRSSRRSWVSQLIRNSCHSGGRTE